MTSSSPEQSAPQSPEEAEAANPEQASTDLAAETPPHEDAAAMEDALRQGPGFLVGDDPAALAATREAPTEDGPGTSLT